MTPASRRDRSARDYARAVAFELAQVNIARLLAPLESPALADFVANLEPVERERGPRTRLRVAVADRSR